jgi:hypothetical protein
MNMFPNWKTSLAGVVTVLIPIINQLVPVLPPQYAAIASGVVAGLGLLFAKDMNVTGGTTRQ